MKKMLIDDTQPEETRVVILDGNKVEDVEFESSTKKQIKGNIFTAKVVRIEPSLQAAFVDYGGNRHGFLAFSEIHPDYYTVSDDVKAEVEAEVEEIIERKRQYQAERKAEQERRRLEREQKRAEYEARRAAEEQAAATQNQMENTVDENGNAENNGAENASVALTAGSVAVEGTDDFAQTAAEVNVVRVCEEVDEAELQADCGCQEGKECRCGENCTCGCQEGKECRCGENCEEAEDEADAGEGASDEKPYRGRRRGARFLGRGRSAKKYKVSAEAVGLEPLAVSEDIDDDDDDLSDNPQVAAEDNFDDDEKTCREFDNDEDEADFEHYLEVQRQLIYARKLYYRSAIQEVIKEGQTLLIQIVKEERGNKGAACTTYLSLAGRYCVLMPNRIKSGGVSRKITSPVDRRRLKDIMHELPLNDNMSLIIRTAGEDKKREDIVRDYNYLIRTWNHIRHSALSTPAPALIYEEGNLIKRALRDMYTKDIGEVIIDGDVAYKTAKDFAKILSPNMGRKIKFHKSDDKPLFQQYQVERELDKLHNPVVQLPSGGYLVINPTEALVSIDVNSGRATHEMDIEETALKTNLEAADEIAKQLRMRNLAGLVVVDFIDMDEPANNHAVEKRMKEAMKPDRARVQIAKMSIFGLLEISRQRMHSSFVESNYVTCPYCKGQGVQRSAESSAMLVLRAIEEEGIKGSNNHLELKLPYDVATYILNQKRRQLADLEEKYDLEIIISADLSCRNINDYKLEKSRVARAKPAPVAAAAAYAAANETTEADDDDIEDDASDDGNDEKERSGRRNNRFRRGRYNRRRGRYSRDERDDANRNDTPANMTGTAEPEKKKAWWKKLLGN
ncbi:MAG: Rne/Rng family ribonuclease [Alphaproteobacteria bacterium]|nr:Rne/Rng family ribonuclease [Alphaproteobacteria bacterium]